MAKIPRPPRTWSKSCVDTTKQQEDPRMKEKPKNGFSFPEELCLTYWNELSTIDQATIWIEGLKYCKGMKDCKESKT